METASSQRQLDPHAVAFGRKLQNVLDGQGLSRRAFAKRVAPQNPEGVRRAVNRHLAGVHMPNRLTRRHYEIVLAMPSGSLEVDDDEESDPVADLLQALRRVVRNEVEAAQPPIQLHELVRHSERREP